MDCDGAACPRIQSGCPEFPEQGELCEPDLTTCFYANPLSSCESESCTCSGAFTCARVAEDGASCAGAPSPSCGSDAPRDCVSGIGDICACGSDNLWHCVCSCYTAGTECGVCPATYSPMLEGVGCTATGSACSFPDGHSCQCAADASGSHFRCT